MRDTEQHDDRLLMVSKRNTTSVVRATRAPKTCCVLMSLLASHEPSDPKIGALEPCTANSLPTQATSWRCPTVPPWALARWACH